MGGETHPDIVGAERLVLQALCQDSPGELRSEALPLLAAYRFHDSLHQVVFDAIRQTESARTHVTQAELQRRLVLSGFPGIPAEQFFEPHALDRTAALALIRRLLKW